MDMKDLIVTLKKSVKIFAAGTKLAAIEPLDFSCRFLNLVDFILLVSVIGWKVVLTVAIISNDKTVLTYNISILP